MPSILDLVNEYFELERQKTDAGGALDQAAELRLQCLKFFLEFDLGPPYMHPQSAHTAAVDPAGEAFDERIPVPGDFDEIPGAELTGIGSSPIPDDIPPPEAAGHSTFYDAAAPEADPGPVADPSPAGHVGGPLDVHEDVLSQTVDEFFSSHVEPAGAEGPVDVADVGPDEIESIPLEEELPPDAAPEQAAAPTRDPAGPAEQEVDVPAAPESASGPGMTEWAAQLPARPAAAAAAADLPPFPELDAVPPAQPPATFPQPAPTPIVQWDAAVPLPEPAQAEPAAAALPAFDLPLTFDVPQPASPPLTPDTAATIPPSVLPAPAVIVEAGGAPAPAGPAFAISDPSRVTVHFLDGDVKRGVIRELGTEATDLCLFGMDEKTSDSFPVAALKAVFVIAQPGTKPTGGGGREMSVTFKDGRNLKGNSPDFNPGGRMFTLYPEPRQGNVDRVIIFKDATDEVK
ncbi:MAG: hypothetical protein HY897_11735 [Deltaproteobacteria bacterium]|nr:hypothetical protein [Deltaproteobacteria bacterium]